MEFGSSCETECSRSPQVCVSNRDERVAVKVVKSIDCYREVARSEIAVLEEINSLDDDHRL